MSLAQSIVVFLKGDTADFHAKIDQAKNGISSLNDSVMGMSTKVGIAFSAIGAGITGFMGLCLKAAGDSEGNISKLNTVLASTKGVSGMTADSAIKLAASLQSVTTYTKGTIIGAENLLLTFTNIGKDVMPDATEAVLNMSTALGQDTKSSAIQLGKALNDPVKGITALSRVGVSFTAQQKEQIKTLVESGKTMEAQKIILGELSTEFGGQAKAQAQTFEGKITNLKNTFMSLKATIGNAIMPMFDDLVKKIKPVIENLVAWIKSHQDFINKAAPVVTVLGLISTAIGALILILPTAIAGCTALAGTIAAIFWPVTIVIGVLAALYLAWTNNFLGIKDITASFLTWFSTNWKDIWDTTVNVFTATWEAIKTVAKAAWEFIKGMFAVELDLLTGRWGDAWNKISSAFSGVWDGIKGALKSSIDYIKNMWGEFTSWMENGIEGLLNKIPGVSSLSDLAGWVGSKMPAFASGGVMRNSGWALVGESGPELVRLGAGSKVFNNAETRNMVNNNSGGNSITINMTVANASDIDPQRLAETINRELKRKGR